MLPAAAAAADGGRELPGRRRRPPGTAPQSVQNGPRPPLRLNSARTAQRVHRENTRARARPQRRRRSAAERRGWSRCRRRPTKTFKKACWLRRRRAGPGRTGRAASCPGAEAARPGPTGGRERQWLVRQSGITYRARPLLTETETVASASRSAVARPTRRTDKQTERWRRGAGRPASIVRDAARRGAAGQSVGRAARHALQQATELLPAQVADLALLPPPPLLL